MKNRTRWTLLLGCLFVLAPAWGRAFAQPVERYELSITNGYRSDRFDWSIAGSGVNVLSELTWKNLDIYQVRGGGKALFNGFPALPVYVRGTLDYGWILGGDNQDSDYNGNNRTLEFSRSNNNGGGGNVFDASAGVGLQTTFGSGAFSIAPLVGYSYHEQNLEISDGFQTIPATGPFAGLHSTYEARWHGPWAGLDLGFSATERLGLHGTFEFHLADYEGGGELEPQDRFRPSEELRA